jgi:hypothetical protein
VPAFIELALSLGNSEDRTKLTGALSALDRRAQTRHGKPFVGLDRAAQQALVAELSDRVDARRGGERFGFQVGALVLVPDLKPSPDDTPDDVQLDELFVSFKTLVLAGYYTSPQGWKELLADGHSHLFHAQYVGCTHPAGHDHSAQHKE